MKSAWLNEGSVCNAEQIISSQVKEIEHQANTGFEPLPRRHNELLEESDTGKTFILCVSFCFTHQVSFSPSQPLSSFPFHLMALYHTITHVLPRTVGSLLDEIFFFTYISNKKSVIPLSWRLLLAWTIFDVYHWSVSFLPSTVRRGILQFVKLKSLCHVFFFF